MSTGIVYAWSNVCCLVCSVRLQQHAAVCYQEIIESGTNGLQIDVSFLSGVNKTGCTVYSTEPNRIIKNTKRERKKNRIFLVDSHTILISTKMNAAIIGDIYMLVDRVALRTTYFFLRAKHKLWLDFYCFVLHEQNSSQFNRVKISY